MLVSQNAVIPTIMQPQVIPFQAAYRSINTNIDQQPEMAWGLPPPQPLLAYQPKNVGM